MLSLWGFVHFLRDCNLRRETSTGLLSFQLCHSRHVQVRDLVRRVPSKNHLFVSLQSKVGRRTCSMLKSMGAFADPISFARRGDILRQNVAKPHNWLVDRPYFMLLCLVVLRRIISAFKGRSKIANFNMERQWVKL